MSAAWMVEALIASALLMAAVLLIRAPIRRWFGPQVAYALWALPALRLLLPPVPAAWSEVAAATPISRAGETLTVLIAPAGAVEVADAFPWGPVLLVAWALGAALFLLWHVGRHRRFCRRLLRSAELIERRDGIAVIASEAARGPLAFGIRARYVAFPRDFAERYDAEERRLALEHEIGHHARGDLLANWAALAVLALHWCNPIAWRAFRVFRADQELANDARVLAGRRPVDRHAYACAIVKAAHGGAVSAACHLHTIEDLKGRLRMLSISRTSRRRLGAGAATVTLLGGIGLGLTVSGSRAAAAITQRVEETVSLDLPVPAVPAPPAPVAAPAQPASQAGDAARGDKATRQRVIIVRDGKTAVYEGAEAADYLAANPLPRPPEPPVPPVAGTPPVRPPFRTFVFRDKDGKPVNLSRFQFRTGPDGKPIGWGGADNVLTVRCGGDADGPVVRHDKKDGRDRIVICNDRMAALTGTAKLLSLGALTTEQNARLSARAGLGMARSAIERDAALSDAQRTQALAGIAQAEAELAPEVK